MGNCEGKCGHWGFAKRMCMFPEDGSKPEVCTTVNFAETLEQAIAPLDELDAIIKKYYDTGAYGWDYAYDRTGGTTFTIAHDVTIPDGLHLNFVGADTLEIPKNVTLTVSNYFDCNSIELEGTLELHADIIVNGQVRGAGESIQMVDWAWIWLMTEVSSLSDIDEQLGRAETLAGDNFGLMLCVQDAITVLGEYDLPGNVRITVSQGPDAPVAELDIAPGASLTMYSGLDVNGTVTVRGSLTNHGWTIVYSDGKIVLEDGGTYGGSASLEVYGRNGAAWNELLVGFDENDLILDEWSNGPEEWYARYSIFDSSYMFRDTDGLISLIEAFKASGDELGYAKALPGDEFVIDKDIDIPEGLNVALDQRELVKIGNGVSVTVRGTMDIDLGGLKVDGSLTVYGMVYCGWNSDMISTNPKIEVRDGGEIRMLAVALDDRALEDYVQAIGKAPSGIKAGVVIGSVIALRGEVEFPENLWLLVPDSWVSGESGPQPAGLTVEENASVRVKGDLGFYGPVDVKGSLTVDGELDAIRGGVLTAEEGSVVRAGSISLRGTDERSLGNVDLGGYVKTAESDFSIEYVFRDIDGDGEVTVSDAVHYLTPDSGTADVSAALDVLRSLVGIMG
mgnify:CR=1 FL=1